MVPIEGSSLDSLARWMNAQEVYWADSTGRRNASIVRGCDGSKKGSSS
jgi:hypothetical protein